MIVRKRITMFAVSVALILTFTACEGTTSSLPQSVPQKEPTADDPLQFLNPLEVEPGMYGVDHLQGCLIFTYTDYSSCHTLPLCSSPNCTHTDESCTAFIPDGQRGSIVSLGQAGALMQFTGDPYHGGEDIPSTAFLIQPDGSDRTALGNANLQPCAVDANGIYSINMTTLDESGKVHDIVEYVPFSGGPAEPLFEMEKPIHAVLGASGREFILAYIDFDANGIHYTLLSKNVDTGVERPLADWMDNSSCPYANEPLNQIIWQDGYGYWTIPNQIDTVYRIDGEGSQTQLAVQWPEEISSASDADVFPETVLRESLIVQVYGPFGLHRFAIDLQDGSVQEIALFYIAKEEATPIELIGRGTDSLLVVSAMNAQNITDISEKGLPTVGTDYSPLYRMISIDDFLAGNPAYQELAVG